MSPLNICKSRIFWPFLRAFLTCSIHSVSGLCVCVHTAQSIPAISMLTRKSLLFLSLSPYPLIHPWCPQMSVLSRQVTEVSLDLQEMTRLLKPLFHNPPTLLIPNSTVTPPPSVSSDAWSPAPLLPAQNEPGDCSGAPNPLAVPGHDLCSPETGATEVLKASGLPNQATFDLLQRSTPLLCQSVTSHPPLPYESSTPPLFCHFSAPPSLNSSSHEHTVGPPSYATYTISSLSLRSPSCHPSTLTPLLRDFTRPGIPLQTQSPSKSRLQSQSHPLLQSQPESHLPYQPWNYTSLPPESRSCHHSLSQPHLQSQSQFQTSPTASSSSPREPILNTDLGEHTDQLSFIDEGRPRV